MPKGPREVSESGYYHVVTRSVGGIPIFEDDADRRKYLILMRRFRDELGVRIIAWVLMGNHVHLILDCGEGELPTEFMRKLDIAYAYYFRKKTLHKGHLFQADYWSKPISNDSQLISTVDYIHRNPERAGIGSMAGYHWSSMQEYLGKVWVVDTSIMLSLMGSVENMISFMGRADDVVSWSNCHGKSTKTDDQVLLDALATSGLRQSSSLRELSSERRRRTMRTLVDRGATQDQVARVFGVSKATVSRVLST